MPPRPRDHRAGAGKGKEGKVRTVEDELARLLPTGPIVGNVATGLALGRSAAVHEVHDMLEELGLAKAVVLSPPAPGGPCYVVTREARRDVAHRLWKIAHEGLGDIAPEEDWYWADADDLLAALLGNVRVAKAVGELGILDRKVVQVDGHLFCDGDTVAVLEDE